MQRRPAVRYKTEPKQNGKKRAIFIVVLLLLLVSATAAWAVWMREDPALARIREMRAGFEVEGLTPEQRREHFEKMRTEYDKLTDEQKQVLRDERERAWEEREDKRMKEFFAKPRDQQVAEIDKRLDEMQEWQKRRQERDRNGGGDRGRGERGGPGGRGGQGGGRVRAQSFGLDANGASKSVSKNIRQLDRRSADSRARRGEYFRLMTQRMKERGMSFPTRGPGGPRGRG